METEWEPVRETAYAEASLTGNRKLWQYQCIYEYDNTGKLVKEIFEYNDGNLVVTETEYYYDSYGRKIGVKHTRHDSYDHSILNYEERWIYKPDRKRWRIYHIEEESEQVCYAYDGLGRRIIEYEYGEDGSLIPKREHFYEGDSTKISKTYYYWKGKLEHIHKHEYDSAGNLIGFKIMTPSGNIIFHSIYRYNHLGDIIEVRHYDENGNLECWEKAQIFSQIETENSYQHNLQREAVGDVVKYDRDGGILSKFLYKLYYNENGNLVYRRDIKCGNEEPIEITYTEITYSLVKKVTTNTIHPIDRNIY